MKKILAAALLALAASQAFAVTAFWNGQIQFVTTVSYQQGVRCGYTYPGGTVTQVFIGGTCPNQIEVQ
jgi:carbohydrate-selective porin OprB